MSEIKPASVEAVTDGVGKLHQPKVAATPDELAGLSSPWAYISMPGIGSSSATRMVGQRSFRSSIFSALMTLLVGR
ncbi:MAG: hypothetical protein WBF71_17075 [Microthrixaceae bacterium]